MRERLLTAVIVECKPPIKKKKEHVMIPVQKCLAIMQMKVSSRVPTLRHFRYLKPLFLYVFTQPHEQYVTQGQYLY